MITPNDLAPKRMIEVCDSMTARYAASLPAADAARLSATYNTNLHKSAALMLLAAQVRGYASGQGDPILDLMMTVLGSTIKDCLSSVTNIPSADIMTVAKAGAHDITDVTAVLRRELGREDPGG